MRAEWKRAIAALVLAVGVIGLVPAVATTQLGTSATQSVLSATLRLPATTQSLPSTTQSARELPSLDLQQRLKDVRISNTPQGPLVTVETDAGKVKLTATEYIEALRQTTERLATSGFFYKLFNISKPWGFVWISVGFFGQAMFTFRMVLQWWASEKHKRSIVPVGFWWGSLIGGVMLFAYFIWRKDIVGIVGQSTGVFVYARNLVLIYGGRRIEAEGARTLSDGESSTEAPRERTT